MRVKIKNVKQTANSKRVFEERTFYELKTHNVEFAVRNLEISFT